MVSTMRRLLILGIVTGIIYYLIEEVVRLGESKPIMILISGICVISIGLINEFPKYYSLPIWKMSIIGTILILTIEYVSGMIFNVWLNMNVWNYSGIWGNINGQICIPFALIWFFAVVPVAIWLDDYLRWKLFKEEKVNGLFAFFYNFFTLK